MIEIYYKKPEDLQREQQMLQNVAKHGGQMTYREIDLPDSICLTIEIRDWDSAKKAADELRLLGEYVEGPSEY